MVNIAAAPVIERYLIEANGRATTIAEGFLYLAKNYTHLQMGDALISTVEYAFRNVFGNVARASVSTDKLHKQIVSILIINREYYNEETVAEIYQNLTGWIMSDRELLNYRSVFDARKAQYPAFDSYYNAQLAAVDRGKQDGIVVVPGTAQIGRGSLNKRLIRLPHVLSKIKRVIGVVAVGVGTMGTLVTLSSVIPVIGDIIVGFLCFINQIFIPTSIILASVSIFLIIVPLVSGSYQRLIYVGWVLFIIVLVMLLLGKANTQSLSTENVKVSITTAPSVGIVFAPTIAPAPTVASTPYVINNYLSFTGEYAARGKDKSEKQRHPDVYTGPGEEYLRIGNSHVDFTTPIGSAGYENGWMLIWYDVEKHFFTKIGWTKLLKSDTQTKPVPRLELAYIHTTIIADCVIRDGKDELGKLKAGDTVEYLCLMETDEIIPGTTEMAYIEATIDGVKLRGLIPKTSLKWE